MNNKHYFKKYEKLLQGTLLTTVVALCSLIPHSIALAQDWESLPRELRSYSLQKLLDQGDYKAFLNAYATSKTTQTVINSDPALSVTLRLLRELEDLLNPAVVTKPDYTAAADMLKKVTSTAQEESGGDPGIYTNILNNLAPVIFTCFKKGIDNHPAHLSNYTEEMLRSIGTHIPREYLPRFDALLTYVLNQENQSIRKRYLAMAYGLQGLARNPNIPIILTLERIERYLKPMGNEDYREVLDHIGNLFSTIARRKDIDQETIEYFKRSEENWPDTWKMPFIKERFERIKGSATSSK